METRKILLLIRGFLLISIIVICIFHIGGYFFANMYISIGLLGLTIIAICQVIQMKITKWYHIILCFLCLILSILAIWSARLDNVYLFSFHGNVITFGTFFLTILFCMIEYVDRKNGININAFSVLKEIFRQQERR